MATLRSLLVRVLPLFAAASLGLGSLSGAAGQDRADLRICASENEAPFSTRDGQGFENRVAAVVAEAMGRKPVFIWSSKPAIYQVRDQLDKNECDVVMGLDSGDERVLTSKPYYRTSYVLVTLADRNIEASDWSDPQIAGLSRFAIRFYSPPSEMILRDLGKYEENASYLHSLVGFKSRRNQYLQVPGDRLVSEVADGKADIAIAFAPEVARYVKASSKPLRMTPITRELRRADGARLSFAFDQSVAVRKGDTKLLAEIDAALVKAGPRIQEILKAEGIPLLQSGL